MPTTWTQKDEKQYKKIRESALERGKSSSEAKEIAARTVNKQRRKEGRTPQETTQGTGNPNTRLEDRTVDELYNLAKEHHIQGRSKLNKAELIEAIRDKRQPNHLFSQDYIMDISRSPGEDTTSITSTLPCFLRGFFENPLQVASCIPSSSYLQRKLSSLSCLRNAKTVIELGPGTGETTKALLQAMSDQSKLLCVEVVEEFAASLQQIADPRLIVEIGSALDLESILKRNYFASADVIVSGIPFSVLSPEEGRTLMESIYQQLAPGGAFVTYQFRSSVCDLATEYFGPPEKRSIVLWNLPPLEIFVWKKTVLECHHISHNASPIKA